MTRNRSEQGRNDWVSAFQSWSIFGAGRLTYPESPVHLVPPCVPFQRDDNPSQQEASWRNPAPVSPELGERLQKPFMFLEAPDTILPAQEDFHPHFVTEAEPDTSTLVMYALALPPTVPEGLGRITLFFSSMPALRFPLSWELVGQQYAMFLQLTCRKEDRDTLIAHWDAHFPDIELLSVQDDPLKSVPPSNATPLVMECALIDTWAKPLGTLTSLDPLVGIFEMMQALSPQEALVYQILFQRVTQPFAATLLQALNGDGTLDAARAPLFEMAKEKLSSPLYAVVVRLAAYAPERTQAAQRLASCLAFLNALAQPGSNQLLVFPGVCGEGDAPDTELALRRSRRLGMLLNARELANIAHIPPQPARFPFLCAARTPTNSPRSEAASVPARLLDQPAHQNGDPKPFDESPPDPLPHGHGPQPSGVLTLPAHFLMIQNQLAGQASAVAESVQTDVERQNGLQVDVQLQLGEQRIACYIARLGHPAGNVAQIDQLLHASFSRVLVCSASAKQLKILKTLACKSLSQIDAARVWYAVPEEVGALLEQWAANPTPTSVLDIQDHRFVVTYAEPRAGIAAANAFNKVLTHTLLHVLRRQASDHQDEGREHDQEKRQDPE